MRCQAVLALLSAATAVVGQADVQGSIETANLITPQFGSAAPATGDKVAVVEDSPAGAIYMATLPDEPFSPIDVQGNVQGSITAMTRPDGEGVLFTVIFTNLPKSGGPFGYHLHVDTVPDDGNCTRTLAHLDPTERGEDPACDSAKPETCQVGDLSGKYGKIPEGEDSFVDTFSDPYVTLTEGLGSFFGNRSFVLHYANKTRITCANFLPVSVGSTDTTSTDDCDASSPTGADSPASTIIPSSPSSLPSPPLVQSGAMATGISAIVAFAALVFAL